MCLQEGSGRWKCINKGLEIIKVFSLECFDSIEKQNYGGLMKSHVCIIIVLNIIISLHRIKRVIFNSQKEWYYAN